MPYIGTKINQMNKENCKHCVSFCEFNLSVERNSVEFYEKEIIATCPICLYRLDDQEIKLALQNMYSSKVSELIYKAYENKKEYFNAVHELSKMGIKCLPAEEDIIDN